MKKVYIILFISIFTNLFCQNSDFQREKEEFEKFIFNSDSTKIQKIKTQKFENIIEIENYYHKITRSNDFKLSESIYELRFNYPFEKKYVKGRGVKVHLYYLEEELIGKIIDYDQYQNELKQVSTKFESKIQKFIDNHNSFYKTKFSINEFINDSLLNTVYGDYCGYSGEKYQKLYNLELENFENAEKYVEWMKSFNLEKQMWGYNQIQYLLKNNLIELEPEEEKIYNHIRERNAIIEMCSGCTFGIYDRVFKNN